MDLVIISDILKKILANNEKVALSGLGSFIVEQMSAEIVNKGTVITPPQKRLVFNANEHKNDNILEKAYSYQSGKNILDSRTELEQVIKQIRQLLTEKRKCRFPKFGDLAFNENGELQFTVLNNINIFPDTLIYEDLSLKPKDIADVSYDDEEIEFKDIIDSGIEEETVKEVDTTHIEQTLKESITDEKEINLSEVFEPKNAAEYIDSAKSIREEEKSAEMNEPEIKDTEIINEKAELTDDISTIEKAKKNKLGKTLIISLFVLIIIVLCIILIYVFRDSLRPFLERILYTEEQRQILDSVN